MKSGTCHVSHALSINSTSEIEDIHEFDEILCNTNFDELDIMNSLINGQLDVSEELLGVTSAFADGATGMTGIAPHDRRCVDTRVGLDPCHFATPRRLLRPSIYCISSPVYLRRLIESGVYSKLACNQENTVRVNIIQQHIHVDTKRAVGHT